MQCNALSLLYSLHNYSSSVNSFCSQPYPLVTKPVLFRLNNRKLSTDLKDTRSMSSSTMWLNEPKDDVSGLDASLAPSLGDVRRDRAPALNVDQDEFGR